MENQLEIFNVALKEEYVKKYNNLYVYFTYIKYMYIINILFLWESLICLKF